MSPIQNRREKRPRRRGRERKSVGTTHEAEPRPFLKRERPRTRSPRAAAGGPSRWETSAPAGRSTRTGASSAHASHGASVGATKKRTSRPWDGGEDAEVEGPTRGVGAEALDARPAPLLVGGVGALDRRPLPSARIRLRSASTIVTARSAAQSLRRRVDGPRPGDPGLVDGERPPAAAASASASMRRVGVARALVVLVLELGRDHGLHVAQSLEHDVLVVLQGALDPTGQHRERLLEGCVAAREELARRRLGLGARAPSWAPRASRRALPAWPCAGARRSR